MILAANDVAATGPAAGMASTLSSLRGLSLLAGRGRVQEKRP